MAALSEVLASVNGHARRAAAESICQLPLSLNGPYLQLADISRPPVMQWRRMLRDLDLKTRTSPVFFGRSQVAQLASDDRLLVVKLARKDDSSADLLREAVWVAHLRAESNPSFCRFHIPEPLQIGNTHVFA
jgi:hypothetical protein